MYGEILLYLRMGKYQEAKELLETLSETQTEIPGVNYLMALIAEQIDGPERAKELLQREMEINPWNFNAYLRWQQLSPGASDRQTSPVIALVKKNLEGRTVGEKRAKTDFAFDKEINNEVKALVSNGTARTTMQVSSDGVYLLTVIARGMSAGGIWPLMYVKVDESDLEEFYADTGDWKAYSVPINISSGSHTIEIAFTNDKIVTAGDKEEDCNLFLERVVLLRVPPPRDFLDSSVTY
jgi:tetratricopeptide (TPR) repeat protein